jgi:hypothetical protein
MVIPRFRFEVASSPSEYRGRARSGNLQKCNGFGRVDVQSVKKAACRLLDGRSVTTIRMSSRSNDKRSLHAMASLEVVNQLLYEAIAGI